MAAPPALVSRLLSDGDALLRLNPEWEVLALSGDHLHVRYERSEAEADYRLVRTPGQGRLRIELVGELPRRLEYSWEPVAAGSRVGFCEEFGELLEASRAAELHLWLRAFAGYVALAARTTRRARLVRWLVDRVWLRMTPTARRVSLLIVAMEALALVLLVAVLLVLRWWGQ